MSETSTTVWIDTLTVHSGFGFLDLIKDILWKSGMKYEAEEDRSWLSHTIRVKVTGTESEITDLKHKINKLGVVIDDWGRKRDIFSGDPKEPTFLEKVNMILP